MAIGCGYDVEKLESVHAHNRLALWSGVDRDHPDLRIHVILMGAEVHVSVQRRPEQGTNASFTVDEFGVALEEVIAKKKSK